jgi:hypothetical protein
MVFYAAKVAVLFIPWLFDLYERLFFFDEKRWQPFLGFAEQTKLLQSHLAFQKPDF